MDSAVYADYVFRVIYYKISDIEKIAGVTGICLAVGFSLFIWESIIGKVINLTQTTAIAATTGVMLWICMDVFVSKSIRKVAAIAGAVLIMIAGEIRWEVRVLSVAFAFLPIFFRFVYIYWDNRHDKAGNGKKLCHVAIGYSV